MTGGRKISNPELYPCLCDHCWLFPSGSHYCDVDKKPAYRIHRQGCINKTGTHGHLINYREWVRGECTFFDLPDKEPLGKSIVTRVMTEKEMKKNLQGALFE